MWTVACMLTNFLPPLIAESWWIKLLCLSVTVKQKLLENGFSGEKYVKHIEVKKITISVFNMRVNCNVSFSMLKKLQLRRCNVTNLTYVALRMKAKALTFGLCKSDVDSGLHADQLSATCWIRKNQTLMPKRHCRTKAIREWGLGEKVCEAYWGEKKLQFQFSVWEWTVMCLSPC